MTQNANSNTGWGPLRTGTVASTEIQWHAFGVNVIKIWYDGSNVVKYQWSNDEGGTWQTAVTVDSTAGNNDVMLNTNIAYDEVTGRLHFLYARNIDSGSNAVLCHRYTSNPFNATPTFSAEHVIDSGSGFGTNKFYRVAQSAFNGIVNIHYTVEDNSAFTTDGKIWRAKSVDGGATWAASTSVFTGLVGPYEPNSCTGKDGSVFLTWYDDGLNNNKGGDLYIAISRDGGSTWPTAGTKLTTTTDFGRPRPACDGGKVWIVANKPWPSNGSTIWQDTYTLNSSDNGATFNSPTLRTSHTGSTNQDHPDIIVVNNMVAIIVNDQKSNPSLHPVLVSVDAGASFSTSTTDALPGRTSGATSDAPRLLATTNHLIATGYDTAAPQECYCINPMFALLPQVQTSVLDDFASYGNGTSINTGNWSASIFASTGPIKGDGSGHANRGATAGTFNRVGSYRNNATYTGNVEGWWTIQAAAGGECDIFIWDATNKNGYALAQQMTTFGTANGLTKYVAGTPSVTLSSDANAQYATGDIQALQVIGNFVIGWRKKSGVWYETAGQRPLDTTYRSGLQLEVELAGFNENGPTMDDFGGGSVVVPSSSVAPVISGTVAVGQVLTSTDGTWSNFGAGRFSYQWQTSPDGTTWTNVSNAVLPLFTVADAAKRHRCQVISTNSVGASSAANSNVLGAVPVNTVAPVIPGSAQVGQTLTSTTGTWV